MISKEDDINNLNDISSGEEEDLSDDLESDYYFDDNQDYFPVDDKSTNVQSLEMNRASTQQLQASVDKVNKIVEESVKDKKKQYIKNWLKLLVSKQKKRFELDGYNLDLTYITEKIIAMGFPAESIESIYRNSMSEVVRFFNYRHSGHYRIYNLCSERKYNHAHFSGQVSEFPFDDHQAPTFELIYSFCENLDQWLNQHPLNVSGIHCKAGKGRTGVMICCYLMYSKIFQRAQDALRYYGMIRTKNKKGVTIPSQIRYVLYFEKALQQKWEIFKQIPDPPMMITKLRLLTVPQFNILGGCKPWFRIVNKDKELLDSRSIIKLRSYESEALIEFNIPNGVPVKGDVLINFFNETTLYKKEKMFQLWINCIFFDQSGVMVIDKFMLDQACKDKKHQKFMKEFRLEIHARRPIELDSMSSQEKMQLSNSTQFISQLNF